MSTFHKVTNNATGILQSTIDNDDTSFSLASGEGSLFPVSGPFFISIEDEILDVLSRTSDTFTISTRGAQSTVATSHASGAIVNLFYTAEQIEELQDAINSSETNILNRVVGGGASTDNAIPRFDSTTGLLIQNSGIIIDDSSNITGISSLSTGTIVSTGAFNLRAYGNNTQHIDYNNDSTTSYFKVRANDATDVFTISEIGEVVASGMIRPWNQWVPASAFLIANGTPSSTSWTGGSALKHTGWLLDQSSTEELACMIALPAGYTGQTITTEIYWTGDSTGSGAVRWITRGAVAADGGAIALAFNSDVDDTYQGADILHIVSVTATESAGRALSLGIGRRADHANDTLAQDAVFLGAMISIL